MFGLKLKDKYKYKEYVLMDEETGELHGKITRSEEDIIKEIILFPVLLTGFILIITNNIYIGVIAGLILLLVTLYSALEKVNNE